MRPEAIDAMLPYLRAVPGNPSGSHSVARAAKTALEASREQVAGALGCAPSEVVFTGSGTEADNLAVRGSVLAARREGRGAGVVVSAFEHKGVLEPARHL